MRNREKRRSRIPVIGDMLFSLLTLPIAMGYIQTYFTDPENPEMIVFFVAAFFLMGIARLFRAFRYRRESRLLFVKFLVYGILMIAGCLVGVTMDEAPYVRIQIVIYMGTLIADRVISCVLNHKPRNLILNGLAIILLGMAAVELFRDLELKFVVMVIVVLHSLMSIMSVSFARINLKMLANVARETYAAEIIGGMVLLIFAISYVLRFVEPNLNDLEDALWYCFAIVTTIGFGDITAVTTLGRLLSVILGMYGLIVVALITSVIVNYYGEMKRENAMTGKELSEISEGKE